MSPGAASQTDPDLHTVGLLTSTLCPAPHFSTENLKVTCSLGTPSAVVCYLWLPTVHLSSIWKH